MNSDNSTLVRWLKYLAEHAPTMEIKYAMTMAEEIGELNAEATMDTEALALLVHAEYTVKQTVGDGRLAIMKAIKRATSRYRLIKDTPTDGNAIDELMAKWEKDEG